MEYTLYGKYCSEALTTINKFYANKNSKMLVLLYSYLVIEEAEATLIYPHSES